LTLIQFI